jgi:putative PIN family toxin of toxin-antitoxin system
MRAVVDTGVLVSALIRPRGTTGAVLRALRDARFTTIYSTGMLVEVIDVLGREKFRTKYHLELGDITALVNLIRLRGELVVPNRSVSACRDPKDDQFLEVALAAKADCLISRDADLLEMISTQGIPILRPVEFLARL